jgi:hypothetical protein
MPPRRAHTPDMPIYFLCSGGQSKLEFLNIINTYFFLRCLVFGSGSGTADFGSVARRETADRNLSAAAGPSLKSAGPVWGLPRPCGDLGGIAKVYHFLETVQSYSSWRIALALSYPIG